TPTDERDHIRRTALLRLGPVAPQRARSLVTVEGFQAEQTTFKVHASQAVTPVDAVQKVAAAMLSHAPFTPPLDSPRAQTQVLDVAVLVVSRSPARSVVVVAVTGSAGSEDRVIRVEELTDGTNVARHNSFTRHVCDTFTGRKATKADILWVVDDSGSMRDD